MTLLALVFLFGLFVTFPVGLMIGQLRHGVVRIMSFTLLILLPIALILIAEKGPGVGMALAMLGIPILLWWALATGGLVIGLKRRRRPSA